MISIVIPNYDGSELLRQNLPGVIEAARREGAAEIIVVDDASRDGSVELVRDAFPSVRVIALETNAGFGAACMAGARAARGDVLVLLNSDVRVEADFLGPRREGLADDSVFAVSAVDLNLGTPEAPREVNRPYFRRGFMVDIPFRAAGPPPFETVYAPGGYSAYRKEMFLALGGFDPLYEPFYWEDYDICYRAWKRGWRTLVEPRSLVRHEHERGAIASTQRRSHIETVSRRNRFLFVWKNVTSRWMLVLRHLLPLLVRITLGWAVLDTGYYLALLRALGRLRAALEGRREEHRAERLTDEEVFARFRRGGSKDS